MPTVTRRIVAHAGRLRRREEGATLLETAFAYMIVLAVIFGIIQIGLALYTYNYVSDAAREATRYAIVRGSASCTNTPNLSKCGAQPADITTYVQNLGYPGLNSSNVSVTTTWYQAVSSTLPDGTKTTTWASCNTTVCNSQGNQVQVVVAYTFPLSIPFWRSQTLNISSTSQMVVAQ